MTNTEVSVIETRPFPTRFAILPSSKYVFSQSRDARDLTAQIILERTLSNGLQVMAVNYGLLAFDFAGTNLGAFNLVEEKSAGVVPDEVTASREHMLEIQARRLQLAGRAGFLTAESPPSSSACTKRPRAPLSKRQSYIGCSRAGQKSIILQSHKASGDWQPPASKLNGLGRVPIGISGAAGAI